jgi:hypothetical protein
MKLQKTYILKIILLSLIFFVFSNVASAITGSIDTSVENEVKVCKDNTCANPKPGIIYFKVSSDSPLVIDTEKGLSGKVWGDELGWVTFNPPYGGVFFADSATGLLKGTAWSENSGAINFSVTGQKVVIDPKTGEWKGWAWASGPYGGWVKFDCKDKSCVHTIWSEKKEKQTSSTASPKFNLGEKISAVIQEKSKIISDTFNIFITSSVDLFNKAGQMTADTYNFLYSNLIDLRSSVLGEK